MSTDTKTSGPFLDDVSSLIPGSHKQVRARCQAQTSDKCVKQVTKEYRLFDRILTANNGQFVCPYCSLIPSTIVTDFSLASTSPDSDQIGDPFFSVINTETKAYLLGLIIGGCNNAIIDNSIKGDTTGTFRSSVIRSQICAKLYSQRTIDIANFVCSKQMVSDVRKLIVDEESQNLKFPEDFSEELTWTIIRGLFDVSGNILPGHLCARSYDGQIPSFGYRIPLVSKQLIESLVRFCNIKNVVKNNSIYFTGINAIDFLSKLYDNSDSTLRSKRNYIIYLNHLGYEPSTYSDDGIPRCAYVKTLPEAVAPSKNNASDEGYDLHLISVDKKISEVTTRYETGIKVQPSEGWHIELLPRSSLSNSGYILSNSVGLIDASYRGTLKVVLTKVDPKAPDLQFPYKAVQMVLRKSIHFICDEEAELDDTKRSDGGFGSTDSNKK